MAGGDHVLYAYADHILPTNIKTLIMLGTATNGVANDSGSILWGNPGLSNALAGGSGNDSLYGGSTGDQVSGGAGDDFFYGGAGNDVLTGGGGNDKYLFGAGWGQDHVVNGVSGGGTSGEIDFEAGITSSQIWLSQSANDLILSRLGTQDRITVDNWYSSAAAQISKLQTLDGSRLDSGLAQLVQAMATYSAAHPGFDPAATAQMPNDSALQTAIATAWHQ